MMVMVKLAKAVMTKACGDNARLRSLRRFRPGLIAEAATAPWCAGAKTHLDTLLWLAPKPLLDLDLRIDAGRTHCASPRFLVSGGHPRQKQKRRTMRRTPHHCA